MKNPIIFYDDECSFCQRFKIGLERMDSEGQIQFLSIHDPSLAQNFPHLPFQELSQTVHLLDKEGKIFRGPEVVEYLIHFFPSIQKLSWLLESNVGQKALDFFYHSLNDLRKVSQSKCSPCKK